MLGLKLQYVNEKGPCIQNWRLDLAVYIWYTTLFIADTDEYFVKITTYPFSV